MGRTKRVATQKRVAPFYSVHPSVAMMQAWIADLHQKTGRTLDEWIDLVQEEGPEPERRTWLKAKHGLGINASWWIAQRAEGKGMEDGAPEAYLKAAEGYVEAMFEGKRAGIRPIFETILEMARRLGPDVKVCPCKTIVPVYRQHVFAEIKPATTSRIDLGFALDSMKAAGRLVETGGFEKKDRITHRIPIESLSGVDAEVKKWLKYAYDLDA